MRNEVTIENKYIEAVIKGADFLSHHQTGSGSLSDADSDIGTYYKAPYALAATGERRVAARLLNWIQKNSLLENGDFSGPGGRGVHSNNAAYPNAWITVGAQLMGYYGITRAAMKRLSAISGEEGFFYRVLPQDEERSAELRHQELSDSLYSGGQAGSTDVLNTSMGGLASLATGNAKLAINAGEFVVRMFDLQPNLPEQFYFQYSASESYLIVQEGFDTVIDRNLENQKYFQIGIAAAFLAKLSEATGDTRYLTYARKYLDVTESLAADRYSIPMAGKVGWGAAYVYNLTGEKKYANIACQVADSLVALQGERGNWKADDSLDKQLEVTAEFVMILGEINAFI